jgi:tetratricopeptide (TPR) repeat protein
MFKPVFVMLSIVEKRKCVMINTKIYKAVYGLSEKLMAAANKDDREVFDALFAELEAICTENEDTDKDHPEQWETLADFTEELVDAISGYEKALEKATAINSKDHMSSIAFSMARLQIELGQTDAAINNLQQATINANKIADRDLKEEINALLNSLLPD